MSKENEEQFRCGPVRWSDPLPGPSHPGEDRCEVGLTGRTTEVLLRVARSLKLILTWRDRFLDRCDLSTTIFQRNVRQGEVFLPRPPPLSPSGQVDISDAAFTSWGRLPGRERPGKPIPDLAPDLAVEILSKSNTKAEMKRKLAEYFQAGTRRVWLVDPRKRTVRVHTSPDQSVLLEEGDTLLAGDILPGFRLVSTDLFPTPRRSENHPDSCAR
ncbi:MAG: Uma2 family endonuclease [Isosphaeraceae bacterium]